MARSLKYLSCLGLFLLLAVASGCAVATPQDPDRLLLRGSEYRFYKNPAGADIYSRMKRLGGIERVCRTAGIPYMGLDTGNWDGYTAKYEIDSTGRLWLADVVVINVNYDTPGYPRTEYSLMRRLYPGQPRVAMGEVNDVFLLPLTKEWLYWSYAGVPPVEWNLCLKIKDGCVVEEWRRRTWLAVTVRHGSYYPLPQVCELVLLESVEVPQWREVVAVERGTVAGRRAKASRRAGNEAFGADCRGARPKTNPWRTRLSGRCIASSL